MGALAALISRGAAATRAAPETVAGSDGRPEADDTDREVFPQSVASGGPAPSGTVVWTRTADSANRSELR